MPIWESVTKIWGLSEEFLRRLMEEAPDDYTLGQWLKICVSRGLITSDQAGEIFNYIAYVWGQEEARIKALPLWERYPEVYATPEELKAVEFERHRIAEERGLEREGAALPPEEGLGPKVQRLYDIMKAREAEEDITGAEEAGREWLEASIEQQRLAKGMEYLGGREAYEERYGELSIEERQELVRAGMEAGEEPPRRPKPIKPYKPPPFKEAGIRGPWTDWLYRKYPHLVRQFEGEEPEERTKPGWAELLRGEKEKWYGETAEARRRRTATFAPKIRTVVY